MQNPVKFLTSGSYITIRRPLLCCRSSTCNNSNMSITHYYQYIDTFIHPFLLLLFYTIRIFHSKNYQFNLEMCVLCVAKRVCIYNNQTTVNLAHFTEFIIFMNQIIYCSQILMFFYCTIYFIIFKFIYIQSNMLDDVDNHCLYMLRCVI